MTVTITLSDSAAAELRSQLCTTGTPPGGGTPPIVTGTANYELTWQNTTVENRLICYFTCNDKLCIHFRTPSGTLQTPGMISMAEYGAPTCHRYAVLSTTPGDFSGAIGQPYYNVQTGVSLSWNIQVGGVLQSGVTPLAPNTDYYINVRNTDLHGVKSCTSGDSATMFCELRLPA